MIEKPLGISAKARQRSVVGVVLGGVVLALVARRKRRLRGEIEHRSLHY